MAGLTFCNQMVISRNPKASTSPLPPNTSGHFSRRIKMKTTKHASFNGSLGKIVKTPAIFLLFGLMGFTFLAEGQGITIQDPRAASNYWKNLIENQPRPARPGNFSAEERIYTGPGSKWANKPWGGPPLVPSYYSKFDTPSYTPPNYTHQLQSGRTLQWKTGAGQQLRVDRLYVGLDANLILKAFGRPDKVSWQYSTCQPRGRYRR